MAPKKKPQKQRNTKSQTTSSSSGPRLQISTENESRLRRLLLNSSSAGGGDGRFTQPSISAPVQESRPLSKAQKAKKLKIIYEKLSCEGFADDQIELALSNLKENTTFESALDWLCLNLPGNELPLKFSSVTSLQTAEGSVSVLSTARDDWSPPAGQDTEIEKEDMQHVSVRVKAHRNKDDDDETLDSHQPSQADWIRQYMEQQEEDESRTWEDDALDGSFADKDPEPRSYDVIAEEYRVARLEATKAKERGDKKSQEQAGFIIRKLKKELFALGLSDGILARDIEVERACASLSEGIGTSATEMHSNDPPIHDNSDNKDILVSIQGSSISEDESEEVELGDGFFEDAFSNEALPPEVLELQKKEKFRQLSSEKNLEKLEGIWKKGDPLKIPKAVLHQLCQKSGWEAPKYSKVVEKNKCYAYAVSVLRKASGRGKSRKAGGLITLQLPDQNETFESAEEAQNRAAAYALHELFPDLPVHLMMPDPYASLILQWKDGETSNKVEHRVEDRRAGFVDWLLDNESTSASSVHAANSPLDTLKNSSIEKNVDLNDTHADQIPREVNNGKDMESSYLRQKQENKKRTQKYLEMSKARAALPIAGLKNEILKMLKENNVLVICGETGSGKTTQVPQFILDDMIESGYGGNCNIICTQPRRIAAISVAERVADERCEPSPGSDGSLVGYQVRLDAARNKKTKLLFCTTGILLRKLAGDRNLTGITHVIVDEVHERSLLGDFLLIILKNLIEKQSACGIPKLKVVLMSATVDSGLFSRYFGNCPVLTAQGRTHPVTTSFLEDVYESINYRLPSDSPAALTSEMSTTNKSGPGPVNNHRGKKNLILSGWGDDSLLLENCINPDYVPSSYQSYSKQTQENLKKLNEDVIDYDLLEDLVHHIDETCDEGAILVFLPGVSEIHMLLERLTASYQFSGQSSDWILPLHSSIASTDQKRVFLRPPEKMRKVILATNIAETSITIDDIVYVIDCGRHKENRYNPQKKLSSMVEDWISQANARQRRGRAGRVKPGTCFCLYTRHRFEKLMRPYQAPEMLRMPLVELSLQIKLLSLGHIKPFLSKALEPPKEEAVASAISLLYEVGAIEGNEELTPLGHHLAKLPVDVLIGKMMLYGAIFGCLSPILSISAVLSYKSPFVHPKDEWQNVQRMKLALLTDKLDGSNDANDADRQSDHLLMMVAYRKWEKILRERGDKAAKQFCNSYFLSSSVMYTIRDMRIQFGMLLADIGLINLPKNYQITGKTKENMDHWLSDKSQSFNAYSHHSSIVKAILCAGLYPNVAATREGIATAALQSSTLAKADHLFWYDGRREVHIHPSSINSKLKAYQHPFVVFLEKVETNRVFLRDTTITSPFSILLFGGSISIQHQTGLVIVDGWLKLTAPAQSAVLFKELRSALHALLKELILKPENASIVDNEVVRSMVHLLLDEDKNPK